MTFKYNRPSFGIKNLLQVTAFAVVITFSFSCEKIIEEQQKNIIIEAMTNGTWRVQQYKENTTDVTSEFMGYIFQFKTDETVDATKNSALRGTGNWSADIGTYSIQASFLMLGDTLKRLNYTWKITDSYPDSVVAKSTTTNNMLHLVKTK